MILVICSVFDSKAEAWLTPLFFQTCAQALRSFGDAVNQSDSDFAKHPEDYTLFHIGMFDPRSGVMEPKATPLSLAVGVNLLREG